MLTDQQKQFAEKLIEDNRVSVNRALELAENLTIEDQVLVLEHLDDEQLEKPIINNDDYIFICSVISPDGGPYSYDRKIRPNEVWDVEATSKIGEEMFYKNLYPACMTQDLIKAKRSTAPFNIMTETIKLGSWIDKFQIGKDAILEGSIITMRNPFSEYQEYYAYLDVFTWSHLFLSDMTRGLKYKESEKRIRKLAELWITMARSLEN